METVVEEEVAALIDNDSAMCKVGFLPVTTLSARCASLSSTGPRRQSLMVGRDQKNSDVVDDAQSERGVWTWKRLIEHGNFYEKG